MGELTASTCFYPQQEIHCLRAKADELSLILGWLFLFAVLYSACLLFGMVFFVCCGFSFKFHAVLNDPFSPVQIIMYSDLESDYINPIDFCNKLNQVSFIGYKIFRATHSH